MQEARKQSDFESFQKYFKELSADQQAGFLLWPSVAGTTLTEEEKKLFKQIKPSGVVLFKRNFSNIEQSKQLIAELKNLSSHSSFENQFIVATDEEGGRVSRLPLPVKTKPVFEFVKNSDKEGLKKQTLEQIKIAKQIGVNCFLTPVLDIFTEKSNTVIGDRSFGETTHEVCDYAEIVFDVLKEANILTCGKHFPGHGNTKEDSHMGMATSDADQSTLLQREWKPFEYFIQLDIPMIMAAHVILPKFRMSTHSHDTPATLNFDILSTILRERLKFKGLILSDDLRMGAIQQYYQLKNITNNYLAHAGIDALKAGCDVLLSCHSILEEKIPLDAIAQKIKNESDFFDLCCKKSFSIVEATLKVSGLH